jgi:NADPH:quinone reductase-like Zn-dependent oxidoreductase
MRAVVFHRFGRPAEVLAVGDRPVPQPGPGEVRVRTRLSPIHNHDLSIVSGTYGYRPPLPAIPGTEAVGTVDAVGPDVDRLQIGQRVSVAGASGTWAECFVAAAASAVPIPDALDDEAACQLLAMPLSAVMLLDDLRLQPGAWLVQNAANGAVGRLVDSLAPGRGLHVVNLVRSASAAQQLRSEGVQRVVATDAEGWKDTVAQHTGGAPVVSAIDGVGGRGAKDLLDVLATGATLVSFGAMSGEPLSIDAGQLIFKQATVRGFWAHARGQETSAHDRERMVGRVISDVLDGTLRLKTASRHGFGDVALAVRAATQPGRGGKVALQPDRDLLAAG